MLGRGSDITPGVGRLSADGSRSAVVVGGAVGTALTTVGAAGLPLQVRLGYAGYSHVAAEVPKP